MKFRLILIAAPIFGFFSIFMIYTLIVVLDEFLIGMIYLNFATAFFSGLIFIGIYDPKSHYSEFVGKLVNIERVKIILDDGIISIGNFYRSSSQIISTPEGKRYPDKRPVIVFFHGFQSSKEESEKFLIPLAHLGFLCFNFDQRGHGEAGGKKSDFFQLMNDVNPVLNKVCSASDVKEGSICCIGSSMGSMPVLTKCYEDVRVVMVIGISALHSVESLISVKYRPLSIGWFFKRSFKKSIDKEKELKAAPYYYLKQDREYNTNRVFFIHARNDLILPVAITFELNKKHTRIPEDQALLLDRGSHGLEEQEIIILATFVKWLNKNKKMRL